MSKEARVAETELWDIKLAPQEIDVSAVSYLLPRMITLIGGFSDRLQRVIRECFVRCRPVCIFFPVDMVTGQVPASLLERQIDLSLPVNQATHDLVTSAIAEELGNARNPCIFVDGLVRQHQAIVEVRKLVDRLRIPVYCSVMGKHVIPDDHEYLFGLYNGLISDPGIAEEFATYDLVLVLGNVPCDTNTGGFSRKIRRANRTVIEVDPFQVQVR